MGLKVSLSVLRIMKIFAFRGSKLSSNFLLVLGLTWKEPEVVLTFLVHPESRHDAKIGKVQAVLSVR